MTRKGIAWILLTAFLMLLGISPVAALAEESHAADIAFLEAVSIIEEGVYEESTPLTRGEATKLLVQMAGMTQMAQSNTTFADVPFSNPYSGYVRAGVGLGVIHGFGDGNFYPDNTVTYNQAVKMLVTLLGYAPRAESYGGYPSGYLAEASRLEMLRGTSGAEGEITFGCFAHLVKNALHVDLFAPIGYGDASGQYSVLAGATILSEYHGIDTTEAIVLADHYTTLTGERVRDGYVLLESGTYAAGKTDITSAIGHKVTAYIARAEETVLYYEKKSVSTETVVESTEVSPDKTSKTALCYVRDKQDKTVAIDASATLVYNFSVKPGWTRDDLLVSQSTIRLVSPDGGDVKYIFVEAYENLYIESASEGSRRVYFQPGGSMHYLELDNSGVVLSFTDTEGQPFSPLSVFEWDVVSMVRSTDGKYIRAIHSLENVTGTVQEVSDRDIRIDDTVYEMTDYMRSMFANNEIRVGDKTLFTMDFTGKIAAADTALIVPYKYGWLVNAEKGKGISGGARFKIFTEDGEMKVYEAAEKIKLDTYGYTDDTILDGTNVLFENGSIKPRLVRYELSGNGLLKSIETETDYTADMANAARLSDFSRDFHIPETGKINKVEVNFIGNKIQLFATKYAVRSSTRIFAIPEASAADDKYKILDGKTFAHGAHPNTTLYDIDEEYAIGAVVWNIGGASGVGLQYPETEMASALVSKLTLSQNEDGEAITNVTLYTWEGKTVIVSEKSEYDKVLFGHANTNVETDPAVLANGGVKPDAILLSQLAVGDIVQYKESPMGGFSTLSILYRAQTPGFYEAVANGGSSGVFSTVELRNYYGDMLFSSFKVEKVTPFSLITHVDTINTSTFKPQGKSFERSYPITSGAVLLCETDKNGALKISPISTGDIKGEDVAITIWKITQPIATVIYR